MIDDIHVLVGPTAVGKKEVGLPLARELGADVCFMDSIKVYRGLEIGAARPDPDALHGLHAYLAGVCDPDESFSVGRYLDQAADAVREIRARGRRPLFLGGTPLYLQGLLRGFFRGPPADPALRERLSTEAEEHGVESLHARLSAVDPVAAARIQPRDFKRICRALEVHQLCGRPLSELQESETRRVVDGRFRVAGLTCEPSLLHRRQELRVDRMLERGLVDEVRRLRAAGRLRGEAALAIGYREVADHLDGRCSLDEARDAIVVATRQLHRKQRKWFRRFPEIRWVERTERDTAEELIRRVREALASGDRSGETGR